MKTLIKSLVLMSLTIGASSFAADKTFIDYFQPTPVIGSLTTNTWGAPGILPRDPQNGLEDQSLKNLPLDTNNATADAAKKWYYWDGQIIKSPTRRSITCLPAVGIRPTATADGAARRPCMRSVIIISLGLTLTKGWSGRTLINGVAGRGHNVTALVLPDGRYAVLISETRPGSIYISEVAGWAVGSFKDQLLFPPNEFSGNIKKLGSTHEHHGPA